MVAAAASGSYGDGSSAGVAPSELDSETQTLVRFIFDDEVFTSALLELNLDPAKLPLGALSSGQLDRGEACLEAIEAALNGKVCFCQTFGRAHPGELNRTPHHGRARQRARRSSSGSARHSTVSSRTPSAVAEGR